MVVLPSFAATLNTTLALSSLNREPLLKLELLLSFAALKPCLDLMQIVKGTSQGSILKVLQFPENTTSNEDPILRVAIISLLALILIITY